MDKSNNVYTYYTIRGQEDTYGNTILEKSLREWIRNCLNFIEEETLLQINAWNMGDRRDHNIINRNPKCHTRIPGEGIEYYYACTNNHNWWLSLYKNKSKKNIKKTAKEDISRDKITTKQVHILYIYMHGNIALHTNW